eukprot:CAMPEP_0176070162 /NCGR_PEP_ID=MMETSP0120_2-20121206/35035_1 /TAXON_ID=160619 /ORGANISM="Kryptoperidinium foliaceum, Strain CCMP 1326" /LENGTH=348 /DNA_ID=CAMNT_0017403803 /DNA_START=49 /DNA_END=1093 /DNA_ORIENTATION=-
MADAAEDEVGEDQGEEQEAEPPVVEIPPIPLSEDAMELSQVGKTIDGVSYTYFQLDCVGKNIGDVDILASYVHLRHIDLSKNRISDLGPLRGLDFIMKLNLADNAIESMDPLLGLQHLLYLDFSGNRLKELPELQMPSLKHANFSRNQIMSCANIRSHRSLQVLNVSENELQDLVGVSEMGALTSLMVASNKLTSIDGLSSVPALRSLDLSKNCFEEMKGPFADLVGLNVLDLSGNSIAAAAGLEALRHLTDLRDLTLTANPLEEQDGINVRLEVLIFSKSAKTINGEEVTDEERDGAKELHEKRIEEERARLQAEEEERLRQQAEEEAAAAEAAAAAEGAAEEEVEA